MYFFRTVDLSDLSIDIKNIESLVHTVTHELSIFDLIAFDKQHDLVTVFHSPNIVGIIIIHRHITHHFEI